MISVQTHLDSSAGRALKSPTPWVSVAERLPEVSGIYLVTFARWPEVLAPYVVGAGFILDTTDAIGLEDKITFWAPVPSYPRYD